MNHADRLDLMLFETSADGAREMLSHGVTQFLVDWEHLGKHDRQSGYDTEVAPVGEAELRAVAGVAAGRTWCRINGMWDQTSREIDSAIEAGARGIFLPMVRRPVEVERFLGYVRGRCQTAILLETVEGLHHAKTLAEFPVDRVYFGLNDFAISRGGGSIFRALLDGSVERARLAFVTQSFGFGGVTAVDAGDPVPCRMLIQEMARLDCQFSFMRRSFRRDLARLGATELVDGVQAYWHRCRDRSAATVASDRATLQRWLTDVCRIV